MLQPIVDMEMRPSNLSKELDQVADERLMNDIQAFLASKGAALPPPDGQQTKKLGNLKSDDEEDEDTLKVKIAFFYYFTFDNQLFKFVLFLCRISAQMRWKRSTMEVQERTHSLKRKTGVMSMKIVSMPDPRQEAKNNKIQG